MKYPVIALLILTSAVQDVLSFPISLSYPISPRPLRQLVAESEYIVIGHVLEVTQKAATKKNPYSQTIAKIAVREVLQGKIKEKIIEVPFAANIICPAPSVYIPHTDVLTFLDKQDNKYVTHALSYGTKNVDQKGLALYKQRIAEIQKILSINDIDTKFVETVEWLVKCAEQEATRWEGAYELSPESHFISFYSRSEHQPFKYLLTSEQKSRLKAALLNTITPSYADLGLIDLVYTESDRDVYNYMIGMLRKLSTEDLWIAHEYMRRLLLEKPASPELKKIIDTYEENQFKNDDNGEQLRTLVSDFIAAIEK